MRTTTLNASSVPFWQLFSGRREGSLVWWAEKYPGDVEDIDEAEPIATIEPHLDRAEVERKASLDIGNARRGGNE